MYLCDHIPSILAVLKVHFKNMYILKDYPGHFYKWENLETEHKKY